jgi:hypothetical protein
MIIAGLGNKLATPETISWQHDATERAPPTDNTLI